MRRKYITIFLSAIFLIDIARFLKNVVDGKHQYIGFAIIQGYKSIDYQDPSSGNTALHMAVRLG